MVDDFPEAFERFEDALPDEIDKKEDTYDSLKQQFQEWQKGKMTRNQDIAFRIQLEERGIREGYSRPEIVRRNGKEYYATRGRNGRFIAFTKKE